LELLCEFSSEVCCKLFVVFGEFAQSILSNPVVPAREPRALAEPDYGSNGLWRGQKGRVEGERKREEEVGDECHDFGHRSPGRTQAQEVKQKEAGDST
jgi:hypothetical protein